MTKPAATLLSRKVAFAKKHWRALDGAFEIAEDGWLYTEYWRPLHSFRLVAVDKAQLCADCAREAGGLVESYAKPRCSKKACAGVRCEPIQFILLDLPRRSGKTTGSLALGAADIFRGEGERVGFVAGSEDQSERLFEDHFEAPITESKYLSVRAKVIGHKVLAWKSASDKRRGKPHECFFEYLPTSLSGVTGGKYTRLIVEEARNVVASIAAGIIPAIWDQNGWRCGVGARGHTKTRGDLDDPNHQAACATCGAELQPWVGQFVAQSSAGEITGGDKDWFHDLCDEQIKNPHPRVHVYRSQDVINRRVAKSSVNATSEIFGNVDSLRDHISIETSNTARRRGEDFLTHADVSAVVEKTLTNRESGERPGVAFLDTSDVVELTSLVIVEDDSAPHDDIQRGLVTARLVEPDPPWSRVVVTHIHVWDPKKLGRIEAAPLEEYIGNLVPLFKLLRLRIDDRHAPWVRNMVARLKKLPWGRIVVGCTEYTREDRRFAWNALEARVLGKTIRIPDNAILRKELRAARKSYDLDGRMDVREESRKLRHLDVAESLAGCCYDVHALASKRQGPGFAEMRKRSVSFAERLKRIGNNPDKRPGRLGPNSY